PETPTKSWMRRVGTHHPLPLQNDDLFENETALPRTPTYLPLLLCVLRVFAVDQTRKLGQRI
ncbi:MAG: hypothetical protein EAZ68_10030, partial [Oscillatoriales cyanobacterium]